jgi:RHS repeat-associated protein
MPVVLVVSLVAQPAAVAKPSGPAASPLNPQRDKPVPGVPLAAKARPADATEAAARRTATRPAPVWPKVSTVDVNLPAAGARQVGSDAAVRAGSLPVWLDGAGAVGRLRVQTFDRSQALAAGINGLLLSVDRADGTVARADVRVSVDPSAFATAYGADWAARLRLVALPACVLTTPKAAGCATPTDLGSTNRAGRVAATVPLGGTGGPAARAALPGGAVLALTAGPKSGDGDYAATPLTASATWSAGGSSGDFSWSYPIRVPPSLGGPAPSLKLSYSAQAVDGRTAVSNNQPEWTGEGFSLWSGYIERRYKPCADDMDGAGHNNTEKTGDLCWETDNASLALADHSGELLKDPSDPNRWHLRNDDGSLITHKTGAPNGARNGEWWVVTTTSGTQYWFGGVAGSNATWTMPVFGNDPGEPCHQTGFAASSCVQAYRWNLDFVVDPHGNTMSYTYVKETNRYARNNTNTDVAAYDRGGYIDTVSYGTRQGETGAAPMQVKFGVADRCLSSCGTHDAAHWPDVAWDQECTGSPCNTFSPTFWSTKRLATITTRVADRDVERWTFTHTFPDPGDGTRAGLWLSRISHVGLVGTTTSVPDVVFSGVQLQNRVDTQADQLFPMNWWRISRVDTEAGGAIKVSYAPPECVPGTAKMPNLSALQDNTLRCYPIRWTPDGYKDPIVDLFHKYVVAEVREGDLTGGAPDVVHSYEYVGAAAWHYTDDDGLVKKENKTWSVWRGYGTVRERTGDPANTPQTLVETQFFRGMNGDHLPSGTRSVTLPAVDLNGDGDTTDATDVAAMTDEDAFAGQVRTKVTYNGPGGPEVSASVQEPWQSAPTATRTVNGTSVYARFLGTAASHSRTALDTDGGTRPAGVRSTTTRTTFDAFGMAVQIDERGDNAVSGDEHCTLTDYARNTNAATGVWLASLPKRKQVFAVGCAAALAGGLTEADVVSDTRTLYDGLDYGATPTKGDATEVQELNTYAGGNATYLTTVRTQYDQYGRGTDRWDVENHHTTTAYVPATGGPVTQQIATNQLGWTTTTTLEPAWGSIVSSVDVNGKRTDTSYDGLGRRTAVWLPGRDRTAGQSATATYAYTVRANGANAVVTSKLAPSGGYVSTVDLRDGLLRTRQTQVPDASVAGARVVTDTLYDSAGRAWKTTNPYPMTGAPATDVAIPRPPDYSGPEAIPAWTEQVFDGTGRTIASIFKARNVERWRTTTAYTGDRTDVTPPPGGTATSTVTDAAGQTVALRQYRAGGFNTTTYEYNRKGQLTKVTDPAGNHWDYTFDLRGRQIRVDDPDKGRTTSTYDDVGRLVTSTDARGQTLAYTYDSLGRKTTVRDGSVTGPKRAEWVYDTVARGQLGKTIRYLGIDQYTYEIQSYSADYRPGIVKYTLPMTEAGFGASSFSYTYNYNPDRSPASTRVPAAGGLPMETLTYGYDGLGQPTTIGTNLGGTLVTGTGYSNFGEASVITLRNNAGKIAQLGYSFEEGTRRVNEIKTTSAAAPTTTYSDLRYSYDPAGNITRIADTVSGDNQCFDYDQLRRLTQAWTPSSGDCTAAPTVSGLGGPAPYWQSWTFDTSGNRRTAVGHAGTDTTATYTYPAAGGARPHGLDRVDYTGAVTRTDSYGYDDAGNTTSRPGQTLTWDPEGHLATAADTTGTTSFVYDADGTRLIRKDPGGKTLYLPGQEIRATPGGTTATRTYAHAGHNVAVRTPAGLTWLTGDHQGTTLVAINAVSQAATIRRLTPFGDVRGVSGTWPAGMDKGLVGGTVDNTGLTHLGAREYDSAAGRFVSVDPVIDLKDPQQLQAYSYANNTPVTASDASGMVPCIDECGGSADREAANLSTAHNLALAASAAMAFVYLLLAMNLKGKVTVDYGKGGKRNNKIPGANQDGKGGDGYADIIFWGDDVVYVWEVKPNTEYGRTDGPADLDRYVTNLQKELEAKGDHRQVLPGPWLPPIRNIPMGNGLVVDTWSEAGVPGVRFYGTKKAPPPPDPVPDTPKVPVPVPQPQPQPQPQPNPQPSGARVPTVPPPPGTGVVPTPHPWGPYGTCPPDCITDPDSGSGWDVDWGKVGAGVLDGVVIAGVVIACILVCLFDPSFA